MDNENMSVDTSVVVDGAEVSGVELSAEQVAAAALRAANVAFATANGMPEDAVLRADGAWVYDGPIAELRGRRYRNNGSLHEKHGPVKSEELTENRQKVRAVQAMLDMEEDKILRECFQKDSEVPADILAQYNAEILRREKVQPVFQDMVPDNVGSLFTVRFNDGTEHEGSITGIEGVKGRKGGVKVRYTYEDSEGNLATNTINWRDRSVVEFVWTKRTGGQKSAKNPRGPRDPNAPATVAVRVDAVARMSKIAALEKRVKSGKITDAEREELNTLRAWRDELLSKRPV